MAGDAKPTIFEKVTGKRYRDINLPNESGKVDPRLKGTSVREALGEALKGTKILQDKGLIGKRSPGGSRR